MMDKSFFVSHDRLEEYEEFANFKHEEKAQIVEFIQLAYHKESQFVKDYESIPDRLMACLKESSLAEDRAWSIHLVSVGIDVIQKGLVPPELKLTLDMIDDMISCYLARIQNSNDFEMYITFQMLFWEYSQRLRSKVSLLLEEDKALKAMDTKVKITDPCFELVGKIDALRLKIFGGNEKVAKKADEKLAKPTADNWARKGVKG
jgi:hypothetical protein